jgi:hypothetical protein
VIAAERWVLQFAESRQTYCTGCNGRIDDVVATGREGETLEAQPMVAHVRERIRRPVDSDDADSAR